MPPNQDLLAEALATREVARVLAIEADALRAAAIVAADATTAARAVAHAAAAEYFDSVKVKPPKPPKP